MTDGRPELPELRAADADRERVADILRDALAEGRLEMTEFEERLDAAYQARTYGELAPLTADLPVTPPSSAAGRPNSAGMPDGWAGRIGGTPTSRGAFAMWSGFRRKGRWTAPRRFTGVTFQGGGKIDLREADFETPEITIRCIAVQGGIEVVVPPGVQVRVKGFALMGRFRRAEDGTGDPGAPVVNITGFVFQGGVDTQRKATKAERQRLKEARREALGERPRKELG
ncbi:DUF1707 SHOCT-like domain-containing protein [Streptomyces chattanoogensis]|uniref:DUF1707 domain-containing protein n=1 Tax=Streptomyces chattanoogensis TaxID=66876 RepID=A0A0N1JYZ1_9ACTN|nr:DUF1707 domain-containing protein [Streptomyces chattanoogensis]KPC64885.1 hypothetical protein ADL29_09650 [Streptomyces chattanoogensis]